MTHGVALRRRARAGYNAAQFMSRRVFVTGLGAVSSIGFGRQAFWESLAAGKSGASPVEGFDTGTIGRSIACEVKGFRARDWMTAAESRRMGRCSQYAVAAARMAVEDAKISPEMLATERTAVVIGTTMGEADVISELESAWIHRGEDAVRSRSINRYGTTLLPIHVARAFGARGMTQTLPAACAAGNYSIGFAADQIRAGRADVALTGASEIIEKLQFAGFARLGAIAPERCQPFDLNRKGLLVGEGSGMMVLESEEHARSRGAHILAEVGGYGLACDAHHITRPHPEGEGSVQAMRRAIEASGLTPADVDFVNAHGTGTDANDKIEALVMHKVFGDRVMSVPISSMKSMIGHCMGASSALEAVSCVETLVTGIFPPTIGYETPDPGCVLDLVTNTARRGKADVVLNNALAFGGYDAVLLLAREGVLPDTVGRR
jgi:3-oxoacyl-[acyl-carrier-protein] synthase II